MNVSWFAFIRYEGFKTESELLELPHDELFLRWMTYKTQADMGTFF